MTRTSLQDHLSRWAGADPLRQGIASAIISLAEAGIAISELVAAGALAGELAAVRGHHQDGDSPKELRQPSPTAWWRKRSPMRRWRLLGSREEAEEALVLDPAGTLAVAVDPLDGSSNIDTNVTVGTIFSILPYNGPHALLQAGNGAARRRLPGLWAADRAGAHRRRGHAYLRAGPRHRHAAAGEGAGSSSLPRPRNTPSTAPMPGTGKRRSGTMSAIAWKASEGPRAKDFNTRWIASMVADAFPS